MATQLLLDWPQLTRYNPDDFIIGDANRRVHQQLLEWPSGVPPLRVLAGAAGVGKTHLAHVFSARTKARWYNPADLPRLLAEPQPADMVLAAAQTADEEHLFHLINRARARVGRCLLIWSGQPQHHPFHLADTATRVRAADTLILAAPDDSVLEAVVTKLAADRQMVIPAELPKWMVARVPRAVTALAHALQIIDSFSLATKKPISLILAKNALEVAGMLETRA